MITIYPTFRCTTKIGDIIIIIITIIIIIIITFKPAWRYRAAGVRTSSHLESAGTGRTAAPCS